MCNITQFYEGNLDFVNAEPVGLPNPGISTDYARKPPPIVVRQLHCVFDSTNTAHTFCNCGLHGHPVIDCHSHRHAPTYWV